MAKQVQVTWGSEGKTYTMFGKPGLKRSKLDLAQEDSDLGLVFRLINHVFSELETRTSGGNRAKGSISFSMFQIYNERVYDLLQKLETPLEVKEDEAGWSCVPGLTSFQVLSAEETCFMVSKGERNRIVRETEFNTHSSRSHTMVLLEYTGPSLMDHLDKESNTEVRSRLTLCDLAGSERMGELMSTKDKRFSEMRTINLSLTALGKVIQSITSSKHEITLPPYRDSMLTRVLKSTFVGNGRATILVTIDPDARYLNETLNSIRFARLARKVKTIVRPRVMISRREPETTRKNNYLDEMQQEIKMLKSSLNLKNRMLLMSSEKSIPKTSPELKPRGSHQEQRLDGGFGVKMVDLLQENLLLKRQLADMSRNRSRNSRGASSFRPQASRFESDGESQQHPHELESPVSVRSTLEAKKQPVFMKSSFSHRLKRTEESDLDGTHGEGSQLSDGLANTSDAADWRGSLLRDPYGLSSRSSNGRQSSSQFKIFSMRRVHENKSEETLTSHRLVSIIDHKINPPVERVALIREANTLEEADFNNIGESQGEQRSEEVQVQHTQDRRSGGNQSPRTRLAAIQRAFTRIGTEDTKQKDLKNSSGFNLKQVELIHSVARSRPGDSSLVRSSGHIGGQARMHVLTRTIAGTEPRLALQPLKGMLMELRPPFEPSERLVQGPRGMSLERGKTGFIVSRMRTDRSLGDQTNLEPFYSLAEAEGTTRMQRPRILRHNRWSGSLTDRGQTTSKHLASSARLELPPDLVARYSHLGMRGQRARAEERPSSRQNGPGEGTSPEDYSRRIARMKEHLEHMRRQANM